MKVRLLPDRPILSFLIFGPSSFNRQDGGLWSHRSGFESLRRNRL